MTCGIYRIRNLENDKCYVGQSVNVEDRWQGNRGHLAALRNKWHSNTKLQNAWNKHGEESFAFEILQECDRANLSHLEAFWITKLDSVYNGYNIKLMYLEEDSVCYRFTADTRLKMSFSASRRKALGLKQTERTKCKISSKMKNRVFSEEHKLKISAGNQGKVRSEEFKQRVSKVHSGKKLSEEQKKRVSEVHSGKTLSEEHKQALLSSRPVKHSEETKRKISEALKRHHGGKP